MKEDLQVKIKALEKRLCAIEAQLCDLGFPAPAREERYISVKEAAALLGYAPGTVYKKISAGELPHYHFRNRVVFNRRELELYIQMHRVSGGEGEAPAQLGGERFHGSSHGHAQ